LKSFLLFLCLLIASFSGIAQKKAHTSVKSKPKPPVQVMPQFPGGDSAMIKYIDDNLKYPDSARANNIEGRVFVTFTIDEDGKVADASLKNSIGGGCDEEALRVIKAMPTWKPGSQDGEGIRVDYTIPINFQLGRRRMEPAAPADTLK
jgi:protein TonB